MAEFFSNQDQGDRHGPPKRADRWTLIDQYDDDAGTFKIIWSKKTTTQKEGAKLQTELLN